MADAPRIDRSCATRSLKVARHLQRTRPDIVPPVEPLEGFASVLEGTDPSMKFLLRDALAPGKVPAAGSAPASPLFAGSLVFAHLTITAGSKQFAVAPADLEVAMKFAGQAAGPISTYASQYGPNALAIAARPIPLPVSVPKGVFNDSVVQGWVDQLVQANALPATSTGLVVLSPRGPLNTDADPGRGVIGYHGRAAVPYAFVNVLGPALTLPDPEDLFALALSHEIAELTVDPDANLANPEVCDPCGPNCQTPIRAYFDATGAFLGASAQFPPPYEYGFFVNAIVQPASSAQCPAPATACEYPPPKDGPAPVPAADAPARPKRRA
ncbi:MAG: hypothetical protein L3K16_04220 [Thermoplasmata archaeon]|nr:hypothetical protein [Thermoplasmata archaeon]